MALDVQLLVHTLVYFLGSISGFATVIPLGLTSLNFNGKCILYGTIKWHNASYFTFTLGDKSVCNFPIYLMVFGCILYGAAMGGYHLYAVCTSRKDPTIGSQMWVMPFLMTNSLLTVLVFIGSCLLSVGLDVWCNGLVNGAKEQGNKNIQSCSDGQKVKKWTINGEKYNGDTYYTFLSAAQSASWICFLIWLTQVALSLLRLWRNRRSRSQGDGQIQSDSDRREIASVEPTA